MNRTWIACLLASTITALPLSCTTAQDLGDRPPGGGDGDGGPPGTDGNPPAPMRVFFTRTSYSSNFQFEAKRPGGMEGGDALCQLAADGARLGGTWAAWLSDRNIDAIDRIDNDSPWWTVTAQRTAQRIAFRDRATIGTRPLEPLTDEYGMPEAYFVPDHWSGTLESGRGSGQDCSSWSVASTGADACAYRKRLLCFEQRASPRKRAFVTSAAFRGNFASQTGKMLEEADKLCTNSANAANLGGHWRAWISDYQATPRLRAYDRLATRADSWTLVDRTTVVVSSRAQLLTGLEHAIDRDESNREVPADTHVWTGTYPSGAPTENHCRRFASSDPNESGYAGIVGQLAEGKWTAAGVKSCDKEAHLYCFEQ
ncbi:hypothetical protein [Pendulispora albinea]|uniref:DUF1554 domain-containing protein n=1 Tax=Pendulispora albinea TaxID=2741071 RepID=A0ABZ2LXD7_9BACT